jgi:hypothetical protein
VAVAAWCISVQQPGGVAQPGGWVSGAVCRGAGSLHLLPCRSPARLYPSLVSCWPRFESSPSAPPFTTQRPAKLPAHHTISNTHFTLLASHPTNTTHNYACSPFPPSPALHSAPTPTTPRHPSHYQALEALRKLRTEKTQEVRELKLKLDNTRTLRDQAQVWGGVCVVWVGVGKSGGV